MARPKKYDQCKQFNFRLDSSVVDLLVNTYDVNLNAQVNHYLSNLLTHLILSECNKHDTVFVYTKHSKKS